MNYSPGKTAGGIIDILFHLRFFLDSAKRIIPSLMSRANPGAQM
jgi:hypothetical protein